jgi:malic enzyme
LDRYRHRLTSFNDDIQGTSSVVVGGILAGFRYLNAPLVEQRFVFLGAGAAGIGIARLVRSALRRAGADETTVRRAIVMLDSKGLCFEGRDPLDEDKRDLALGADEMALHGFGGCDPEGRYDLATVIRHVKPTVLLGTSGTPGAFTEEAIREMAAHVERPLVMPMSNPTSKTEAQPKDILAWTQGRAIVATGSPFDPVEIDGTTHLIGQANNAFVFPGIGLGAIVAEAREIPDEMFLAAADALAAAVPQERLDRGAIYPSPQDLRAVSRTIAEAVVRTARDAGIGRHFDDDEIAPSVAAHMWFPDYADYTA